MKNSFEFRKKIINFTLAYTKEDIKTVNSNLEILDEMVKLFSRDRIGYCEFLYKEYKQQYKLGDPIFLEKYDKYLYGRRRVFRSWIKDEKKSYDVQNTFAYYYKDTKFYKDFKLDIKYFKEISVSEFDSIVEELIESNDDKIERNLFKDFKYVIFRSNREKQDESSLNKYFIKFNRGSNKITLTSLKKDYRQKAVEVYTGMYRYQNDILTLTARNKNNIINTTCIITKSNSFNNDTIIGITVGISKNTDDLSKGFDGEKLNSRKIIFSKKQYLNRKHEESDKLIATFLNNRQSINISNDEIDYINELSRTGKSSFTYDHYLSFISNHITNIKELYHTKNFISKNIDIAFFEPVLKNYEVISSIISNEVNFKSMYYTVNMGMFKALNSINQDTMNKLFANDDFTLNICIDLRENKRTNYLQTKKSFDTNFSNWSKNNSKNLRRENIKIFYIIDREEDFADIEKIIPRKFIKFVQIYFLTSDNNNSIILNSDFSTFIDLKNFVLIHKFSIDILATQVDKSNSTIDLKGFLIKELEENSKSVYEFNALLNAKKKFKE